MNNFLCEVCGFQTKDEEVASNHKYQHTQQQGFKCDKCNKTIKRRSDYLKHVKEQHGLNKFRFSCNQCNYRSSRKWCVKVHQSKKHKTLENEVVEHPLLIKIDHLFFFIFFK